PRRATRRERETHLHRPRTHAARHERCRGGRLAAHSEPHPRWRWRRLPSDTSSPPSSGACARASPDLDTARFDIQDSEPFMQKARVIAIAGAFAGGLLFAYTLHAAGLIIVLRQIRQIGAGFGVVLLLSGIRMA